MSQPILDELTYLLIEGLKENLCPGRNGVRPRYATFYGVHTDLQTGADVKTHVFEFDSAAQLLPYSSAIRPILTQPTTTHSVVDYEGKLSPNAYRIGRALFHGGCLSTISVCATVA